MNKDTIRISFSTYIIGISFIIGFTGVWILPKIFTNLIKPFVILAIIVEKRNKLYIDRYQRVLIIYLTSIMMCSLITGLRNPADIISFALNILYAIAIIEHAYTEKEWNFLQKCIKCASVLLSVIVVISNPLMSTIKSAYIYLFTYRVNKNAIAYLVAPGLFVCVQELSKKRKKTIEKIIIAIQFIIMLYAGIYPMSRGGFLSLVLPILMWGIYQYRESIKKIKWKQIIIGIGIVCLVVWLISNVLPEQYVNRLFGANSYSYSNSGDRDIYINQAIEITHGHEVFGRGFGYYQELTNSSYGLHNCFADMYVSTGLVGMIGLIIVFFYPMLKCRKIEPFCWVLMALPAALFESQLSYQVWVPLAVGWLSWKMQRKFKEEQDGGSFNNSTGIQCGENNGTVSEISCFTDF